MPVWTWIVIGAAAVVVLVALGRLGASASRRRRSDRLRHQFKSEYGRVVGGAPDRGEAEQELIEREERHQELQLQALPRESSERYAEKWREVQARFVDDPGGAAREADRLVQQVMAERGYPAADFEQAASDVSVEHPEVVSGYRAAHDVYESQLEGNASTEELRHAMVDYRTVVDELLAGEVTAAR